MVKKIWLGVSGFALVTGGVIFIIKDWMFVEMVFRGVAGVVLALTGLVILSFLKQ